MRLASSQYNYPDEQAIVSNLLWNFPAWEAYTYRERFSEGVPLSSPVSRTSEIAGENIFLFSEETIKAFNYFAKFIYKASRSASSTWTSTPEPVKQEGEDIMVNEIDLSPLRLKIIQSQDITLNLKEYLELKPIFDNKEVVFDMPNLNIIASASTRDEAIMELQSDMVWLWKEYAEEDDNTLSEDAIELKRRLIDMVSEISYE